MSILIKGMEMPKNEELIIIYRDGTVEKINNDGSRICEQKAIKLPQRGGLMLGFNACYFDDDDCIRFVPKTITNADRIRSMTDEELVQYIEHDLKPCPPPYYENHFERCMVDDTLEELITNKECDKCWLDWLKKEVEE